MQTLFQKMRANRCRWVDQPIQAAEPAPEVPFMVVDGAAYVERQQQSCNGCAFDGRSRCSEANDKAAVAFGSGCAEREVIYIKAQ